MEIKPKAAFSFRSYSLALLSVTSHPCARHHTAVPWEAGSAQPGRPSGEERCLFPASPSGEQHHSPRGFWHSPAICPWWLRFGLADIAGELGSWCVNLSPTQEAAGRKRWRFATSLSLSFFLSRSLPEGRLSLATNNSSAHQWLFLRSKIIEICFSVCRCVHIWVDEYRCIYS